MVGLTGMGKPAQGASEKIRLLSNFLKINGMPTCTRGLIYSIMLSIAPNLHALGPVARRVLSNKTHLTNQFFRKSLRLLRLLSLCDA